MATVSAPNPTIVGWLLVVGGALQVLGAIVHAANNGNWSAIYAISNIAIGVSLVLMMVWLSTTMVGRIGYLVGAIGWLLLALTTLLNLGPVNTIAPYVAILGSVFAGCIVLIERPFAIVTDVLFFAAMLLGAFELLLSQTPNVPLAVVTLVVVTFGALLVISGIFLIRRRQVAGTV